MLPSSSRRVFRTDCDGATLRRIPAQATRWLIPGSPPTFTSGHFNILRYCNHPLADIEEINEVIVDRLNSCVMPTDASISSEISVLKCQKLLTRIETGQSRRQSPFHEGKSRQDSGKGPTSVCMMEFPGGDSRRKARDRPLPLRNACMAASCPKCMAPLWAFTRQLTRPVFVPVDGCGGEIPAIFDRGTLTNSRQSSRQRWLRGSRLFGKSTARSNRILRSASMAATIVANDSVRERENYKYLPLAELPRCHPDSIGIDRER
jgi:hypothetical protein